MDECFRDMGYLICIARYHPTFYSTLGAAVLAALFAYVSIKMNRKSAREKNSVDFEHNYKNSDKVRDAWLVLMKITQNRLKQPIVEFAKKEMYATTETQAIVTILNEWERAANGIHHRVYDGNYLYKTYGTTVLDLYAYTYEFIKERQKSKPRSYANFCRLYLAWKVRRCKEERKSLDKDFKRLPKELYKLYKEI